MGHENCLVIGHRGAGGHAPENTCASVNKAFVLGADCVEIDVQLVDGQLVVFHDDILDRTTDGTGPLASIRFGDLRQLDAGGGERVPTLKEVFDCVDKKGGVNVELKGEGTATPVLELADSLIGQGWPSELILLSSFDHARLAEIRRQDAGVKIGVLAQEGNPSILSTAWELNAYSIHLPVKEITAALVREIQATHLRLFVFTANETGDIKRMVNLGVDGVFSDYPDRVVGLRGPAGPLRGWH